MSNEEKLRTQRGIARAYLLAAAEEERLKKRERIERRMQRDVCRPMLLPEISFSENFRLSKANFTTLCEDLMPLLAPTQRSTAVRPEIKILAALQMYASGGYQGDVGKNNSLNLSQTKMSDCLMEVTEALNTPDVLRKFIHFPRSQLERDEISRRFMEKFGFPGVLGCIDGTHIAIIRPKDDEEAYFNRKYYHSLNAMVICDVDLRILYIDVSFGGASHDSHIWNSSAVRVHMQCLLDEGQSVWFLGDSGYAQRPCMMTPILNAIPNSPEEYYTSRHTSTRNVIERCFGVLKTRFRCLLAHRVMHYNPIKAAKIANACAVLHNLINDHRLAIDVDALDMDRQRQPQQVPYHGDHEPINEGRAAMVDRLWRSRHLR